MARGETGRPSALSRDVLEPRGVTRICQGIVCVVHSRRGWRGDGLCAIGPSGLFVVFVSCGVRRVSCVCVLCIVYGHGGWLRAAIRPVIID